MMIIPEVLWVLNHLINYRYSSSSGPQHLGVDWLQSPVTKHFLIILFDNPLR